MAMISVQQLTFSYDGSFGNVFDQVTFQMDSDWKLGFVSRNGRGKTTFLHLLMGRYEYRGQISASVNFEYFPYEVRSKAELSRTVVDEICPEVMDWQIQKELSLLDVDVEILDRPYEILSEGEQTKLLLAAMFLVDNAFLLLDEPTNHLDATARESVKQYLRSKNGFILVSHDRDLLDACADHILSINKTQIDIQKGNFSSWWVNKMAQDEFEMAENKKLMREIGRLTESAKRGVRWADKVEDSKLGKGKDGQKVLDKGYVGHKAAKAMKRAKNIEAKREDAVRDKSMLLHNIERSDDIKISPISFFRERLVEAEHLSVFYDQKVVFKDLNFTINRGDSVALVGKNGAGKSSVLKLILGKDIPYTGRIKTESGLVISYVPQSTDELSGTIRDYERSRQLDSALFRAILDKFDFSKDQFDKKIEDYSGGQKKKVLLAASLCDRAHLYVWDEPLNFIDIFSRMQIEKMLISYQPTLIFVEHDEAFTRAVATKTIVIGE